jgi:Lon protease-like protein
VALMPVFPLGTPLLPGNVLPLHVFEPRFRALVRDCLDERTGFNHEFVIVMIERGHEVGGGDERTSFGTASRIMRIAELGPGRFGLMVQGTRRVRVVQWYEDDPYPKADVEDWPDVDDLHTVVDVDDTIDRVVRHVRRVLALSAELGEHLWPLDDQRGADPATITYKLAALAPLGPADLQRVLGEPRVVARLGVLDDVLGDVEAALQFHLMAADADGPGTSDE